MTDEEALQQGEAELKRLGFTRDVGGLVWRGYGSEHSLPLVVTLPLRFPYELPEIRVDRARLTALTPHVERTGKICLAPTTGFLLDASRPAELVREAIERARVILADGLNGKNDNDLIEEFGAYWPSANASTILSFCKTSLPTRRVLVAEIDLKGSGRSSPQLLAAELDELDLIIARTSLKVRGVESSLFVQLASPVRPPSFEHSTTGREVWRLLSGSTYAMADAEIRRWAPAHGSRIPLLFRFPLNPRDDVVFALRLLRPMPQLDGYRAGRGSLRAALARLGDASVERLSTVRADMPFLLRRTGADVDLSSKKVLVVGCGSIGGYLAVALADSGVRRLTLVDHERLGAENVLRHVLGLRDVGRYKVAAVKSLIQSRLPEVEIDDYPMSIDDFLVKHPLSTRSYDLIVFATGDQTLELRLNRLVRRVARVAHVWLEAFGVGAHVLLDGQNNKGCLSCLFRIDPDKGLYCRASLFEPGQVFTRTVAGCSGVFTPFGAVDARQAAIEAARVAMGFLTGGVNCSTLVTWYETEEPFRTTGLLRSQRALSMAPGARVAITEHAGCEWCS